MKAFQVTVDGDSTSLTARIGNVFVKTDSSVTIDTGEVRVLNVEE